MHSTLGTSRAHGYAASGRFHPAVFPGVCVTRRRAHSVYTLFAAMAIAVIVVDALR